MGFSRQEYWSGVPFPLQGIPEPGIEPQSPALQADAFLEVPCFFDDPTDVGHLISGSSAFFLNLACASGSSWFMYY